MKRPKVVVSYRMSDRRKFVIRYLRVSDLPDMVRNINSLVTCQESGDRMMFAWV